MKQKNQGALRYLNEVTGRLKISIFYLAACQAFLSLLSVYYALLLRNIIDAAAEGERNAFFSGIIRFILLAVIHLTLQAVNRWVNAWSTATLNNRLKNRLFAVLLTRDYGSVSAVHTGEWMNRILGDSGAVSGTCINLIPNVVGMIVRLIGAITVIAMMEPRFLYILLPGGALIFLVSAAFRNVLKQMYLAIRERDGAQRVFLQEALGSMLVVRSYGMEEKTAAKAGEKMEDLKTSILRRTRFSNFCNIGFASVMRCASILVVAFCGYGILIGTMTYGTFTAVMTLVGQIQGPISNMSGILPRYFAMIASIERLMEAEEYSRQEEKTYDLKEISKRYENDFEGFGLDHVCFTYSPPVRGRRDRMPVVLCDVSLEIKKGEYVALVGPSGCGKSTMLKLLMSLYDPEKGERYVLEKGKKGTLNARWRKLFAYVPQGNQLMSGTIREIVAFSDEEGMQDEEHIWQALRISCAEKFVSELEDGLDTRLGERGAGLSEGQMQRLAIARAIYSGRPVLMLDECTSSLDSKTEQKLLRHLREMTDRTVLIVTHRPAALHICDKIIEFKETGCEIRNN